MGNTSQSATPTRDEHSDTIGEVIIKKLNKKKRCDVTDRISSSSPPAGELKHRSSTKRKLSEGAVGSMTSNKTAKSSIDISTVKVEGGSDVKRGKFNKTEKLNQESRKKLTKKRKLDTALQITDHLTKTTKKDGENASKQVESVNLSGEKTGRKTKVQKMQVSGGAGDNKISIPGYQDDKSGNGSSPHNTNSCYGDKTTLSSGCFSAEKNSPNVAQTGIHVDAPKKKKNKSSEGKLSKKKKKTSEVLIASNSELRAEVVTAPAVTIDRLPPKVVLLNEGIPFEIRNGTTECLHEQYQDTESKSEDAKSDKKERRIKETVKSFKPPVEDKQITRRDLTAMKVNGGTPHTPENKKRQSQLSSTISPFTPKSSSSHVIKSATPSPLAKAINRSSKSVDHQLDGKKSQQFHVHVSSSATSSDKPQHRHQSMSSLEQQRHHVKKQEHRKRHNQHHEEKLEILPDVIQLSVVYDPAEPLTQKELEKLRKELSEINDQPSYSHIDSSSDNETDMTDSYSPILKSPSSKTVEDKKQPFAAGANRTENLKRLGRVKKKTKVDGASTAVQVKVIQSSYLWQIFDDEHKVYRSEIFEQDRKLIFDDVTEMPPRTFHGNKFQPLDAAVELKDHAMPLFATFAVEKQTKNGNTLSQYEPVCAESYLQVNHAGSSSCAIEFNGDDDVIVNDLVTLQEEVLRSPSLKQQQQEVGLAQVVVLKEEEEEVERSDDVIMVVHVDEHDVIEETVIAENSLSEVTLQHDIIIQHEDVDASRYSSTLNVSMSQVDHNENDNITESVFIERTFPSVDEVN